MQNYNLPNDVTLGSYYPIHRSELLSFFKAIESQCNISLKNVRSTMSEHLQVVVHPSPMVRRWCEPVLVSGQVCDVKGEGRAVPDRNALREICIAYTEYHGNSFYGRKRKEQTHTSKIFVWQKKKPCYKKNTTIYSHNTSTTKNI